MSNNRKRAPRTNLPKRSPATLPADPDSPDMAGNGRDIEISALTFRQQSALPVVAVSRTLAQAAHDSGVAERTLRRWLQDPSFRDQLDRLRAESYDLARRQLQAAMPGCISFLAELAQEGNDPAIRLRAIRYMMTYGIKFSESDELSARLKNAEEAVELNRDRSPLA